MYRIWPVLIIVTLFCIGCATTGTEHVQKGRDLLANKTDSTDSPRRLPYQDVQFGEPIPFAFDEQASILKIGEERRFAKGFALPAGKGSYSVTITSFKTGVIDDPAIMYPEVRLLDEEHNVVRTLPHTDFVFRPSMAGDGLRVVLFINSQRERFLLILNRPMSEADLTVTQSNISGFTPIGIPVPGGYVMWMVPTGSSSAPVKMKASPTGEMTILFEEYRPKKIGGR